VSRERIQQITERVHREPRPPIEQTCIAVSLAENHGQDYEDNPVAWDNDARAAIAALSAAGFRIVSADDLRQLIKLFEMAPDDPNWFEWGMNPASNGCVPRLRAALNQEDTSGN